MNILVIGNGFDLAHSLPTTYKDFLRFTDEFEEYRQAKEDRRELSWEDDKDVSYFKYFIKLFNRKDTDEHARNLIMELSSLIRNNMWLIYFKETYENRREAGKEGWIDFESEISRIIQTLDSANHTINEQLNQGEKSGKMTPQQFDILKPLIGKNWSENYDSNSFEARAIRRAKNSLLSDLNKLIRCLEIYLSDYVSGLKMEKLLPDIEALPIIDKVLSFNYTSTYENYYKKDPSIQVEYIHGRANLDNTIDTNNMVLGIDEYLKGDERNENIEFIEFKKFFQRIHKETGCLYKSWVYEMENREKITEITSIHKEKDGSVTYTKTNVGYHKLFFFGHSLDITDKDVIRDLILADRVQTTIFYTDKADYGRKISNLDRVIGQDELIKRTGGNTKTITFKAITKE